MEKWAPALGISKNHLWLNSWAVKGANGIDWHFDYEDVIHFQIKGDKLLKLLRTPNTVGADRQMKTFERILMEQENFDDAHEEIVTAGTITIIPRGVWHWSENKSDESFAVSLCIGTPSRAEILSKALFKRFRLVDQNRRPLFGSNSAQTAVMRSLLEDFRPLLQSIDGGSVALEENRLEITPEIIDTCYFYLGLRANVSLSPLRILVDGQAIAIPEEKNKQEVLRAVCKSGHGFTRRDLAKLVPRENSALINEVLSSLTKVGFLDFINMADDRTPLDRSNRD